MIAILDYGSGNVRAFLNAYERMKIPCRAARRPEDLADAARIVLPGVGAFDTAMRQLEDSGMLPIVREKVLEARIPLLGVCVGMQMLAHSGEEGTRNGLGWIPGVVRKLTREANSGALRLPHMGWNRIESVAETALLCGLPHGGRFYFLHSYVFNCAREEDAIAHSEYGRSFTCAVRRDNIFAVQFHPEKSHEDGMTLLKNFAMIV